MNHTCLSPCGQKINHFLDCSSPVHIERNINEVLGDRLANNVSLLVGGIFQQFLAEIITERIWEQRHGKVVGQK
jgi:hypothetical protein